VYLVFYDAVTDDFTSSDVSVTSAYEFVILVNGFTENQTTFFHLKIQNF